MKISDEIIKVLDYLGQKIGVTIDWTSKNVLPLAEQLCEKYISWEIATSLFWLAFGAILLITGLSFARPAKRAYRNDEENFCIFYWVVFIILVVIGIPIICTQIYDIIECKVFPEKAIYDYIKYQLSLMEH